MLFNKDYSYIGGDNRKFSSVYAFGYTNSKTSVSQTAQYVSGEGLAGFIGIGGYSGFQDGSPLAGVTLKVSSNFGLSGSAKTGGDKNTGVFFKSDNFSFDNDAFTLAMNTSSNYNGLFGVVYPLSSGEPDYIITRFSGGDKEKAEDSGYDYSESNFVYDKTNSIVSIPYYKWAKEYNFIEGNYYYNLLSLNGSFGIYITNNKTASGSATGEQLYNFSGASDISVLSGNITIPSTAGIGYLGTNDSTGNNGMALILWKK